MSTPPDWTAALADARRWLAQPSDVRVYSREAIDITRFARCILAAHEERERAVLLRAEERAAIAKVLHRMAVEEKDSDQRSAGLHEAAMFVESLAPRPAPTETAAAEPRCPDCRGPLRRVLRESGSSLNAEQFDAIKAGDWYCETCPPNSGLSFRYFTFDRAAAEPSSEPAPPTFDELLAVTHDMLSLVMQPPPSIDDLRQRTVEELCRAEQWAAMETLAASDNIVPVPAKPTWLCEPAAEPPADTRDDDADVSAVIDCDQCRGEGYHSGGEHMCLHCAGTGRAAAQRAARKDGA